MDSIYLVHAIQMNSHWLNVFELFLFRLLILHN